jgi:thiamine pyrophosphate-dependent acetolactate synthase large subunit-like protein
MNLGSLVTIVASGATNITLAVLDNGIYEVTGGQQTAAATVGSPSQVDFAALARAAGFLSVRQFDRLPDWQREAADALSLPGPRFILLAVEPVGADYFLESPGPMAERMARFRKALAET